jgi:hypothetical protein
MREPTAVRKATLGLLAPDLKLGDGKRIDVEL